MESPPKRMTRARAAAKVSESAVKTTKIVTAAAKARTAGTATGSTKSTAAKRKTRADENDNDDGDQETTARRALRARPRKVAGPGQEAAPPVPTRTTRCRVARAPEVAPSKEEEEVGAESAVTTARPRGRPKKTAARQTEEPARKTTRSRAATTAKSSIAAAKPAVKKTVKFQEQDQDKENMGPEPKTEEPAKTGLRGRPTRRRGGTVAPSTRIAAALRAVGQKKPLSPKKVTQMPVSRDGDSSEDELAMEKVVGTPVKPKTMSPIKPPADVVVSAGVNELEAADKEAGFVTVIAPAFGASTLGSPPRRPPSSPLKDSLKSPAKRMGAVPLPGSTVKSSACSAEYQCQTPSLKTALLQSTAKRPQSPIKGLSLPPASASKLRQTQSAMFKNTMLQSPAKRAMPGFQDLTDPRARDASALANSLEMQPVVMATSTPAMARRPSQKPQVTHGDQGEDELFSDPLESPRFPGRLSAVLPRHVDPVLKGDMAVVDEEGEEMQLVEEALEAAESTEPADLVEKLAPPASEQLTSEPACLMEAGDRNPMAVEEIAAEMEESGELSLQEPEVVAEPPADQGNAMMQLRQKDIDPCHDLSWDSESEDELPSLPIEAITPTPARCTHTYRDGEPAVGLPKGSRRSTIGLASLAEQFGSWSATSPEKTKARVISAAEITVHETSDEQQETVGGLAAGDTSTKNSFFEDEMVHLDPDSEGFGEIDEEIACLVDDVIVTDEDVALAEEARDMSVMEPRQIEAAVSGHSFDDSLSEASQEYGDENQVPLDPAMASQALVPVTPDGPLLQHRSFFTTTKVPLKPADESTPSPLKKRSFSASRVTCRRPGTLSRSATVISYSPTKDKRRSSGAWREHAAPSAPVTPSKKTTDLWSTMGTPARTPRRDLNPGLLRGSVVFVDVHTTEGADASGLFIELLNQMGAHCVKTWQWNPGSPTGRESPPGKVGITHVVYKDGSKHTLQKVREAKGIVHCVGVSWVLDCERENEWLNESPYYIDTSHVPRGGGRRRKSKEPKALANLNSTPASGPAKASWGPDTPMSRRDSTVWMRTPSDQGEQNDSGDNLEWSCVLLTPVPRTPAPEAIASYAAELSERPSGAGDDDDDDEDSSPTKQTLVTQTCPHKRSQYREMGGGILGREKDEQVLMRLMAARRKSLQFAPKIGSPLSKTWE